jgi:hypothetical protein
MRFFINSAEGIESYGGFLEVDGEKRCCEGGLDVVEPCLLLSRTYGVETVEGETEETV